jgi:hypothetical protein
MDRRMYIYCPLWVQKRAEAYVGELRSRGKTKLSIIGDRGHWKERQLSKANFTVWALIKILDQLEQREVVDGEDVRNILKGKE